MGDLTPRRVDARGRFVKRAIPGPVKIAVVVREGCEPGGRSPVTCSYCGAEGELWWPLTYTGRVGSHMSMAGFEFDHVYPESKGGATTAENIAIACVPCNRAKKDKVL